MSTKLVPLSNTEIQAMIEALRAGVRLDGRQLLDNRECQIQFGKEYGVCHVTLGDTRVMAKVSIFRYLSKVAN